jgi:hypothetical protein
VSSIATAHAVTLTSTGTAQATIYSAALTGTGFSLSGANFPATLKPGQAVMLTEQFNPTTSGQLSIIGNSSTNGTAVISLSGTGTAALAVLSALSCSSGSMTGSGTCSHHAVVGPLKC